MKVAQQPEMELTEHDGAVAKREEYKTFTTKSNNY